MSVQFNFHNDNGIDSIITLEAPIGAPVISHQTVSANGDFSRTLDILNIQSVKIYVWADPDDHPVPDTETIDVSQRGTPYQLYVTTFSAHSAIGEVSGKIELEFGGFP
jgi:hypothetical protein